MSISLHSYNLSGLQAQLISIQVEVAKGMPHFSITGMASVSIREAKDRVRSSIEASGFRFPKTRKIIHLAPADEPKRGSHLDLPMAVGLLAASGQIPPPEERLIFVGELGLDGGIRPVTGLLAGLSLAKEAGFTQAVFPRANVKEASLLEGVELFPVVSLRELLPILEGKRRPERVSEHAEFSPGSWSMDEVRGHAHAKRALWIAAAGGHHVLLHGPPGTGKTLLARSLASLLPPLNSEEQLEVLQIHSVAGESLRGLRPFRKVHHSVSRAQLLGGAQSGRPGELSLAHRGVLYLDELPEFKREVLESLRQPLEDGEYHLIRNHKQWDFPCQFQLIASMNPCPCGYFNDAQHPCRCHPYEVARYQKKLSGPLLDRLDLSVPVPRLAFEMMDENNPFTAEEMRLQVQEAHERQRKRQGKLNQFLTPKELNQMELSPELKTLLSAATDRLGLSGRALHKCLKVALSIADLSGEALHAGALGEALSHRNI